MDVLLGEGLEALGWAWTHPLWRAVLLLGSAVLLAGVVDKGLGTLLAVFARRTHSPLDDDLIAILRRPAGFAILLGGAWGASAPLTGAARTAADGLIASLLVVIATAITVQVSGLLLRQASQRAHQRPFALVQPRTLPLIDISIKALLLGAGGYFLLLAWGVDPSGWLASAGVVGIAVGFAAKDSLANLFAGLFIIADAPYKLGDYIQLDGNIRGEVTEIGIRSTRIRTRDEIDIILPNAVMAGARIINESGEGARERIRCSMVVPYTVDLDEVRRVLLAAAQTVPTLCLDDPGRLPRVRLRAYEDHGLRLDLLAWIRTPAERGLAIDGLIAASFAHLRQAGIPIAAPRYAVTLAAPPPALPGPPPPPPAPPDPTTAPAEAPAPPAPEAPPPPA